MRVQCAAAELPKIRVLGRVLGSMREATCLDLNCQETAPCRPSLLEELHVSLWALASQGVRTCRLRLDEKQKVDVAGRESKGHSTKVGTGEAGWRCV